MTKSRLPLILIAGGAVLAIIALAMILMSQSGAAGAAAEVAVVQIQPSTPTPEVTAPPAKRRSAQHGRAAFGTSVRDPFMPQATPTPTTTSSSSGSSKSKSSDPAPAKSAKSSQQSGGKNTDPSGNSSGRPATTKNKTDDTKDPESKAPQPIGVSKGDSSSPTQQIEVAVMQVTDYMAVVRINGARTTLYQNVPDVSGVTYVSALGGGCGWFGMGDLTERMTICEGDSRPLNGSSTAPTSDGTATTAPSTG